MNKKILPLSSFISHLAQNYVSRISQKRKSKSKSRIALSRTHKAEIYPATKKSFTLPLLPVRGRASKKDFTTSSAQIYFFYLTADCVY